MILIAFALGFGLGWLLGAFRRRLGQHLREVLDWIRKNQ